MEANIPEMKQLLEQYFLLLTGKRPMKADLDMGNFELVNWNQVLADAQYPNALLLDGSRPMTDDFDTGGHRVKFHSDCQLVFDEWWWDLVAYDTEGKITTGLGIGWLDLIYNNTWLMGWSVIGPTTARVAAPSGVTVEWFVHPNIAMLMKDGCVSIPFAGDITGLINKVLTWPGTIGSDLDMDHHFLIKSPLKHICNFDMDPGVTDVTIEIIPAGAFEQDMHINKLIVAVDRAPGAGKSVTIVLTDGTNTMTVVISDAETSSSTTTGAFDWDASTTSLTMSYSQTAGGLATRATVVCTHHYIATV